MVHRGYNSCKPRISQVGRSKYGILNALSCDVGERVCNGMPEFIRACYLRWAKFPKQDIGSILTLANLFTTCLDRQHRSQGGLGGDSQGRRISSAQPTGKREVDRPVKQPTG